MLIANDESRLIVNVNDLRRKNPRRTKASVKFFLLHEEIIFLRFDI